MKNLPLMLRPSGKDYLWGGSRINDEFEKNIDLSPLAETWECSTHPDGPSYVVSGEYAGKSLRDVISMHPEYLGRRSGKIGDLPLLIKFIDARENLSVQVHPSDKYAKEHEGGQLGKSEMWYVLDATKDAKIIYGFKHDVDMETVLEAVEEGNISNHLQTIDVARNDVFFVQAGTVHAIGAGTLVAEIQENSNITYRLYDYDRVDKNGKKRDLHLNKAVDCIDYSKAKEPRQPLRVLNYKPGMASELLCRCKYFEVYRMLINTERRQIVKYRADSMSFRVLLCINGCGVIEYETEGGVSEKMSYYKGDCIFVPAKSVTLNIQGQGQFLDVRG